jgi:outer membrane receptor protein involved in Fe transport
MKSSPKTKLAVHIAALTAAGAITPAIAVADGGFALEEVVVRAQKREQNLQDVGISVTALAGITDISRLELVTPGMSYGFIGSDAKVAMRGANSNNTFADNSSIAGFFLDGVYRPRASQQSQAYFDVERVEVLKGPQGTLYGRNTFAGAINLYTNKPDTEALSGGIKGSFERFSKYTSEGFINVPINDNTAVRLAFNTRDSDGYIENDGSGEDLGQDEARNFRISGLWQNDTLEAVLRYSNVSQEGIADGIFSAEGICQPLNANGITDAYGTEESCDNPYPNNSGDSRFDEPWEVSTDVDADRDNQEQNVTLDLNAELSDTLSARFVTSWTDWDSQFDWDGDWSNQDGYIYFWDEQTTSITDELQFLYEGDQFKATLGGYYSVDEIDFGFSQYRTAPFDFSDFADYQEIETTTTGIFFQGEYAVNDSLRLIAGIRYSEEDKDTDTFSGSSTDENGNPLPGVNPDGLDGRAIDIYRYTLRPERSANQNFDDTTYRAGVEWDMSEEVMLYANYATGFLSGGVNADGSAFEQQESDAYEAGMKSRWLDDTLQANVAIYYNEYSNLTTQQLVDVGGGVFQTITVNGGEIETLGLEADITWIPTEQWIVTVGLSLMDNEYGTFGAANPFVQANGVDTAFLDLEDETPPWAAEITLSLSIGYDFDLGDWGRVTPFLQVYYSDEYNTDDVVTYAQQEQDSYTKTDFRVIWTSLDQNIEAEAFIENIEDEEVLARTNVGGFDLVQTSYLYPQNYGVRLSYNF